jgi:ubiquinone/menaquinone biosynthesis C-methylase UbiE
MNKYEKNSIKMYNRLAKNYDNTSEGKFIAKFKKIIFDICKVSKDDKVLDIGCGNGRLIHEISRKAPISAYGVDISPNMIKECRKLNPNINFQVSNGETLNFEDGFFDILIINCALHHMNNPQKFFIEAQRILKTNGILIVGEPWYPFPIKQFGDLILPLLQAGDNKLFTHNTLKRFYKNYGFSIKQIYKRGFMQIISGNKL